MNDPRNIQTIPVQYPTQKLLLTSVWAWAILAAAALIVYFTTFNIPFHLDDHFFIVENPNIHDLSNGFDMSKGILKYHARFIPFFSFALNYHFHQLNVFGYHVVNFLVHIITSGLIWWFFLLLFQTPRISSQWPSSRLHPRLVALFAALIFTVHPVNTQAVTYISQRFESMATLFYILTLGCYIKARRTQILGEKKAFFAASALSAIAAMLCKETALSIPIMVILCEICLIRPNTLSDRNSSRPYHFPWKLLLPMGALTLIIPAFFDFNLTRMLFSGTISGSHDGDTLTLEQYVLTQGRVFVTFFRLLFLPINQTIDYDFAGSKDLLHPISTFTSILFILALFIISLRFKRSHFLISFGLWWMLITLSINLIPRNFVIFEHKLYLGGIGMILGITALIAGLIQNKKAAAGILILVIMIMGTATVRRNQVWKDELSLWTDAINKAPGKYLTNLNLGKALYALNRMDDAYNFFDRACRINPRGTRALTNRGVIKARRQDYTGALQDFNAALTISPDFPDALNNRGNYYFIMKEYDKAFVDLNRSIQIKPFHPTAYLSRGQIHATLGNSAEAIKDFSEAIRLNPSNPQGYTNRAFIYSQQRKFEKAAQDIYDARRLKPLYE